MTLPIIYADTPGVTVVRAFPFAYNDAGLDTGETLYTPTLDDVLLEAWIEIVTAWDGTTPLGDIIPAGSSDGFFAQSLGPINMLDADGDSGAAQPYGAGDFGAVTVQQAVAAAGIQSIPPGYSQRFLPAKITGTFPGFQVVVSKDGTVTGGDPGATQGAAILYLVTATPA